MQEIQLLTREDIEEIMERELRGQFQALRDEMLGTVKEAILEAVRTNMPQMMETILKEELKGFRQEILAALDDALRQVTEEGAFPGGDDPGDDYRQ
jgi:hypothetical protein